MPPVAVRVLVASPLEAGVEKLVAIWQRRLPRAHVRNVRDGVELATASLAVTLVNNGPNDAIVFVAAVERSLAKANAKRLKAVATSDGHGHADRLAVYFTRLSDDGDAARTSFDVDRASTSWPGAILYDDGFAVGDEAVRALYVAVERALGRAPAKLLCAFFSGSGVCCPDDETEDARDAVTVAGTRLR